MQQKYFEFLYIPAQNAQPRPFRVPRSLVYGVAAALFAMAAVGTFAVVKYSGKIRETYRLATLERQNEQLRSEVEAIGLQIQVLERQVTQNFDFQKKARILANLDEISDDVAEVGVGGPEYAYIESISNLDPETRDRVTAARADVEKLVRQARLQREGYSDIIGHLEAANEKLRSTPSLRPVSVGFVSSRFGYRMDPVTGRRTMHRGLDFSARLGTPVHSTADGVVTFSGRWKTYGEVVEISHGFGYVTRFAHLQKRLVKKGQKVRRGDVIGRVGSSGKSTFSHLHYEVERDGKRVDPLKFVLAN
jgi:murein DD-endopeptidase MepM/ murein hydrolase activator NlpD